MGRSKNAIYLRARKLNIDLILDRKAWSKKDDEYLSDNWGKKQIETIAKNLNRSVYAVKIHASRTGLGPMADANISEISLKTLSEIFAVHPTTISRTWKSKGLNLKKKKRTNNSFYYCVKLKDLMNFLEKNQNLFDSRYLEKNILGVEPEWLEEKRISDEKTNIYKYRVWTKEEIILAEKMLLSGSNYQEISLKINRSPESIRSCI